MCLTSAAVKFVNLICFEDRAREVEFVMGVSVPVSRMGLAFCGEMDGDCMATRLVVDFVGVLTVEVGVSLVRFVAALGVTSGRDANEEALADKGFPSVCAVGIVKIV